MFLILLLACGHPSPPMPPPVTEPVLVTTPETPPPDAPPGMPPHPIQPRMPFPCGFSTTDWCPAREGDACGTHPDKATCQADPACEGVPYRGESFAPCQWDERCFAGNCPSVGCVARCETLDQTACAANSERCSWSGTACSRTAACGAPTLNR